MKHKSILFVSSGGTSIKSIRIKVVSVFIVIVFVVCGFSAYFIPSGKFRLKAAEVKQKQHMSQQNEMLHQRISSALDMLGRLKQEIGTLDKKKERVVELTGAKTAPRSGGALLPEDTAGLYAGTDPVALLGQVTRLESRINACAARLTRSAANPFDSIPVCKPISDGAIVSLGFGKSRDPFTGKESQHRGVDLSAAAGTRVVATAAGTVQLVERSAVWGNRVVIAHADSIFTVYAHLGTQRTAQGRRVKKGAVIGTTGFSGLTTGPHVHYEIWCRGVAVDPETFFYPVQTAGR
jgi:murein DD-endopeptidase MepM/ murein hydrolase activator NlpD